MIHTEQRKVAICNNFCLNMEIMIHCAIIDSTERMRGYMISPDKVQTEARKKENENFKFRSYLKNHAEEDELDRQFLRLHKELFANYDCSKCRNCCKMYKGSIPSGDIDKDAEYLGMTAQQFISVYLEKIRVWNGLSDQA